METETKTEVKNVQKEILRKSAAFCITFNRWGNTKHGDKNEIQTLANKNMIKISKSLIDSPEYKAIVSCQNSIDRWIRSNSVPAFIMRGISLVALTNIEKFEEYLNNKVKEINKLVDNLIAVYPIQFEEAKIKLGPQFNANDYPSKELLKAKFGIKWQWVKFDIPETLPEDIFNKEKERTEKMWAEARESIQNCLRESFLKLINHATDKLTVKDGEKPKTFKDATINNIIDFLKTFEDRNIANDADLASLIEKTKGIVTGVESKQLRTDIPFRSQIASQFQEVEQKLDGMIVNKANRKFNFSGEDL